MARTAPLSKESIIALRHEGQSTQTFQELLKFLQVQSQSLAVMRTATGKEDPEFSAAEDNVVNCGVLG
jgi:hypothetical protein